MSEFMPDEHWLPAPGFTEYDVSDAGRVWSRRSGRFLKGSKLPSGHIAVMFTRDGKSYRRMVHQLVAGAFIGPRPAGLETRHWNDVPDDNRLVNLCYGTRKQNIEDMIRNGHHYFANRTHCPKNHSYDEANTYWRPDGGRGCRACNNESGKRRKWLQTHGVGEPCLTPGCDQAQTALGLCPKCYMRGRRDKERGPEWTDRTCGHCDAAFTLKPGEVPRKYCSEECATDVRRIASRERMRRLYAERKAAA